ncbi:MULTISPECIES: energy transducer TonB [Methylobacterium]|uniref:TonB C-terminal domain-containing protein n=1 Tax=Methylobacterium jeotgali TaxID=381630 RepID=A0ABQ4SW85_9HYPH|nr:MULTISPECIES: energy transducer TonB [Methylobacterium]PIU08704.1 MAG: hypothetical protein COT56_00370 [Methylobacterium sp. CG09_land_8_20_14_0_10_71_15]PIU11445.1 MAG: hypothetical protein COT28_19360 [Methylobacterium sp. CG08_land_8_20_14_0_20_71_15]GBU18302.1 hypothetical protein AwMethylo_25170 [Methylobacterium sp.]GJE05946.1 hypothetical protein AOPFMNJM_1252 [Methylobacterium jeotgali]
MSTAVTTGGPRQPAGLAAAFLVALSLHLAALLAIAYLRLSPPQPPGENTVSVDLAPQMAEADTVAPSQTADTTPAPLETPTELPPEMEQVKPPEATTQVMPEETVPEKSPEVAEIRPPDAPPVEPDSQVITSTAPEAEPLAPPPPVAAKEPEKKIEKPKPDLAKLEKLKAEREARRREEIRERMEEKREEQRREARAKAAREARARAAAESQGNAARNSASTSRRAGTGEAASGNDANALAQWKGMLSSAIRGRMNRNAAAGTSGGVATVRFTVTRGGQVTSAGLAGSSGVGAIDSAALAAVRGSLPPAPAGITLPSLSVTVPMRFSPGG